MSEATRAAQWRKPQTEVVTLPSGQEAELKKTLNTVALIRRGVFTQELIAASEAAASNDGQLTDASMAIQLQDVFVMEMFVDPAVVMTEAELDEDAILIDDISIEDTTFVVERAMSSLVVSDGDTPFRGDDNGNGPGSDSPVLAHNPKPPSGPTSGSGERVSPRSTPRAKTPSAGVASAAAA